MVADDHALEIGKLSIRIANRIISCATEDLVYFTITAIGLNRDRFSPI